MDAAAPDVAAADQSTEAATAELPKSVVQRIVRAKAVQVLAATRASKGAADAKPANVQISKDALLAFSESGRVFINYLASTAHECAKEGKRVTISAADVFKALEELDFTEFVQPLQQYLEAHKGTLKEKPATKKKEGASTAKKRKASDAGAAKEADKDQEQPTSPQAAAPAPPAEPVAEDTQNQDTDMADAS